MRNALSQAMGLPISRDTELLEDMTLTISPGDDTSSGSGLSEINPGMAALLRILGELTDELGRSINFYLNQSEDLEIAQLLLAGPGAGIGQIDEFFTQRLNLPTMQIDPLAALALEVNEEIPPIKRPGLGIVLGLGMREA
jgi:type IV pilus assembly protein PilM